MSRSRSRRTSSFTIIKGSLIPETYATFEAWDLEDDVAKNLAAFKERNPIGASTANWLRDVAKVLHRRFDPAGRDRALVELAKAGYDLEAWKPLLLWHMTRDEFLLRDFLVNWLFEQFANGTYRIRTQELLPYLNSLPAQEVTATERWTEKTLLRVASGLLRMAADFGLMSGTRAREFVSYHLPDTSFLYLLHAMAEQEPNAPRTVHCSDWRMYMMHPGDVERELMRLHQYGELRYEVAGSLAQLELPHRSARDYARGLIA